MKKLPNKVIPANQFAMLTDSGHGVVRNSVNNIVTGVVGKNYTFECEMTKVKVEVRCTQDCPHHFRVINNN